jgi:DAK2 domain fusion protein YloV
MPLGALSASDLERVVRTYRDALHRYRAALNRLNVYPVPDGDTGTNMSLTLDAVLAELDGAGPGESPASRLDVRALAKAISHGSLMGARGNSGVILSQILRGMAAAFAGPAEQAGPQGGLGSEGRAGPPEQLGPDELSEALSRAADSAYAAVSNPVEGTILTVARAAARGAAEALAEAPPGPSLLQLLERAREKAADALAGTTEQLPALKAAGVVDAGGAGMLLLLDSFLQVVDGREVPPPPIPALVAAGGAALRLPSASTRTQPGEPAPPAEGAARAGPAPPAEGAARAGPAPPAEGAAQAEAALVTEGARYEVMFFLDAPDEAIREFRRVWEACGTSVVVVGGDGLYNCHIHTDDIGGAIEAALEIGRPRQIRVSDLAEQVEEERWVREAEAAGGQEAVPPEPVNCAVVAVCSGEGVKRIFRSLGASELVGGGQSANPSTAEVLDAILAAPAEQVIVLANNPNVVAVAEQAAACAGKKVRVVPTAGIPEGFAALLAYDPEADVDTNADEMAAAASHIVSGEVTQASRGALTEAGEVKKGDWLGLSRHQVRAVAPAGSGPAAAAIALLSRLVSDAEHEVVTVIEGEGASTAQTRRIVEWLSENHPRLTAEVHHGGQPLYAYLFSIE